MRLSLTQLALVSKVKCGKLDVVEFMIFPAALYGFRLFWVAGMKTAYLLIRKPRASQKIFISPCFFKEIYFTYQQHCKLAI